MQTASAPSIRKPLRQPERSEALIKGAIDTVEKIGNAIFVLDLTIEQWNQQLSRAQPLIHGRFVVCFIKHRKVKNGDNYFFDVEPVAGKMVEMKSGAWRFVKLTARDNYNKLSDLRKGKSFPSDAMVVRLINGLEEMLKRRKAFVDLLNLLRTGAVGKLCSVFSACDHWSDEVIDLSGRIKTDWDANASAALQSTQEANRSRFEKKKARAVLAKTTKVINGQ